MLKIIELFAKIDEKLVLKGINFQINEGEKILLIGENGSGKTSFLHAIIGDPKIKITNGKIMFNGTEITKKPPEERAKLGVGIAFQLPPKFKGLTVKKLALSLAKKERVERLARELDIGHLLDSELFSQMSGGERKRVELFLVLLQNPKIFLIDEPDSGVDMENFKKIANVIEKYVKTGIIVSHQGEIAKHIKFSRIAVMKDGKIIEEKKMGEKSDE